MSSATMWVLVVVVVIAAAAGALFLVPGWTNDTATAVTIDSIEAWQAFTARPDFTLLDEAASADYFIAVYRTEADELAFCYRWRKDDDAPDTSLDVRDENGNELKDPKRWDQTTLLNETGPLPAGGFIHGMVVPIRPDHEGTVRLVFRDNLGAPEAIPAREVYARSFAWPE